MTGRFDRREAILDAMAGLVSGALYLSYVLTFLFLIPVQSSFAARGRRSGSRAALVALLMIVIGQVVQTREFQNLDLVFLAVSLLTPAALYGALFFIACRVKNWNAGVKILVASSALSLIAGPLIVKATANSEFTAWIRDYVVGILAASTGQDQAELISIASAAVHSAIRALRSGFAVFILALVGASWWFGSLRAIKSAARNSTSLAIDTESVDLSKARAPSFLLWPALALWSGLFAVLTLKVGGGIEVVAWNLSLCVAAIYGVQGVGIIAHAATSQRAGHIIRLLVPLAVLISMLNSTVGIIVLILVPLLGITEVWLPYRNFKGAFK